MFSSDQTDFLMGLGVPSQYRAVKSDCEKFWGIFHDAVRAVNAGTTSVVFELSTVFLAIRNFATCFSLGTSAHPDFSRFSAIRLEGAPVPISASSFSILERARILSTRGKGDAILPSEVTTVRAEFDLIGQWMIDLLTKIR